MTKIHLVPAIALALFSAAGGIAFGSVLTEAVNAKEAKAEAMRIDHGWTTYEGGYIFADEDEANQAATDWTNAGGEIAYMTHVDDGVCVQTALQWRLRPWCGEEDEA